MKVAELIEFLNLQDPEALVVVDGYEDGLDDDVSVVAVPIELNAHEDEWWNGRHDTANAKTSASNQVPGVWLKGNRRDKS
jgi:hypothetical protein